MAAMRNAVRIALACSLLWLVPIASAEAASLRAGIAAYNRENYTVAASIFHPLAEQGDMRAQSYLGFMYSTGRGVAQNYVAAAFWYHRAAEQGDPTAQYMLGLMYDKGQGVAQDYIEAHKWLNLAAAHASPAARDSSARLRDAVATKMTRGEIGVARLRAAEWAPVFEHPPAGVPH
jgi:TPR repeat protein